MNTEPERTGRDRATDAELESLRRKIDDLDREIMRAFADRVETGRHIGRIKERLGLPILDPAREAAVVRRAAERARAAGLDDEAVREIYWRLVGLSRRDQREGRS